jgi:hypothetical protein
MFDGSHFTRDMSIYEWKLVSLFVCAIYTFVMIRYHCSIIVLWHIYYYNILMSYDLCCECILSV